MMDREKEREIKLETTMYTNCLLLGLDPNVIGVGSNSGPVRAGHFRHSNPKLGEQLLYFILSSLRGPVQSAKDFDKVWPIFDSAQSRDFRKVVQGIISELESQGALPRSNSRVSSLATCCGTRFVELLWQLSLHAVREVHRRAFAADVASSPLPAPLTDVAFSHAATLLPVTKARIALERRRFLKNAETAVQRQALWSSLAHEMTAEFRGLCAEEAYLQQELEKLHDLRNKVKLEGEHWDELVSSSSQNSHMVQRATRLWDSLLSCKSQHEVLASGPIEDLIAHREHRYRISGSSLIAAMDQGSVIQSINLLYEHSDDDEIECSQADINKDDKHELDSSLTHENEEFRSRGEETNMRGQPTVDIAEVLRRWTHALQRIHKQSLQLAKANNGEGPELLRNTQGDGSGSHAESLTATLAEHRQHLDRIQVLIDQLKDVSPTIQSSISELTEEVNSLSAKLPPVMKNGSNSAIQGSVSGDGEILDMTSRLSSVQLNKTSANPQTLKLPPLFSSTPNLQKHPNLTHTNPVGIITEKNSLNKAHLNGCVDSPQHDEDITSMQNLKRSVREAALSYKSLPKESPQGSRSDDSYEEHFFVPLSGTGFSHFGQDKKLNSLISRPVSNSQADSSLLQTYANDNCPWGKHHGVSDMLNDLDSFDEFNGVNGLLSTVGSNSPVSEACKSFYDDESPDQVFSPPLLMDTALLADSYEDLLAPLSDIEFETALMRH